MSEDRLIECPECNHRFTIEKIEKDPAEDFPKPPADKPWCKESCPVFLLCQGRGKRFMDVCIPAVVIEGKIGT